MQDKEKKVLELIKIDENYKRYFFRKVKSLKWFYPLKRDEHFNSSNLPEPIQTESGGYQIQSWLPLQYLVRLSEQLNKEEHHEVIREIINIIKEVSEKKVDNPRIWHDVINILANLPNEEIPPEIFDHIPTWLKSQLRNSLPSSELCKTLLPKFLPEKPTPGDVKKAEIILKNLFTIEKKVEHTEKSTGFKSSYTTLVDLVWLQYDLFEENLIERIGRFCSNDILFTLADNLKKLLLDFLDGLNYSLEDYSVQAIIKDDDLLIEIKNKSENDNPGYSVKIEQFEDYEYKELKNEISKRIGDLKIELSDNQGLEDTAQSITHRVAGDFSSIWCNSVHKLGEDKLFRDELKMVQTLILKDLLAVKAGSAKNDFEEIAAAFQRKKYKQPLFRRLLLYAISENWADNKPIFWEMVKKRDEAKYFSLFDFDKELYFLLKDNNDNFSASERRKLNKIIERGPQIKSDDKRENYEDYWQLKWYSALKNDSEYKGRYEHLSKKLNLTDEHFETLGEVRVSIGSISPFSVDEILEMEISGLVREIAAFPTKERWDEPSVEGFAQVLELAVKKEPVRFANDLHHIDKVPYIYIYYILRGFEEAWKDKLYFNWEKVLTFCLEYVASQLFKDDKLSIDVEGWNTSREIVIGQIGNLITEGTKSDDNAFEKEYLPIVEDLLLVLVPLLKNEDDYEETNMDYPTYSLNSTAGKLLRGLFDFSLRKARIKFEKEDADGSKWDENVKKMYETALQEEIIDGFILLGMYFAQFRYLDSTWLFEKIKEFYDLSEGKWLAFMGGFTFQQAYNNTEIYELMFPHYKRAIKENNYEFGRFGGSGLVNHIGLYYIWGTESISKGSLIEEFLGAAPAEQINRLIDFFVRIKDNIPDDEIDQYEKRILVLWKNILKRFEQAENEESKKVLSNLSNLSVYMSKIDKDNFSLFKSSAPHVKYGFNSPHLLEDLNRLKKIGNLKSNAKYIGDILELMLTNFTPDYKEDDVESLIRFMYQNKEDEDIKASADKICTEYVKRDIRFLRYLYKENR